MRSGRSLRRWCTVSIVTVLAVPELLAPAAVVLAAATADLAWAAEASMAPARALVKLSGAVALQRGDLTRGYEVRLVPADGSEPRAAFVSTNGKYRFDDVQAGTYTLRVVRSGTTYQGPGPKVTLGGKRERIDLQVLGSGRTLIAARRSR